MPAKRGGAPEFAAQKVLFAAWFKTEKILLSSDITREKPHHLQPQHQTNG